MPGAIAMTAGLVDPTQGMAVVGRIHVDKVGERSIGDIFVQEYKTSIAMASLSGHPVVDEEDDRVLFAFVSVCVAQLQGQLGRWLL